MENALPTSQDILEAINAFSDKVDQRFGLVDKKFEEMVTKAEFGSAMGTMVTKAEFGSAMGTMVTKAEFGFAIENVMATMVTKTEFSSAMEAITTAIDHADRKTSVLVQELVQAGSLPSVSAARVLRI